MDDLWHLTRLGHHRHQTPASGSNCWMTPTIAPMRMKLARVHLIFGRSEAGVHIDSNWIDTPSEPSIIRIVRIQEGAFPAAEKFDRSRSGGLLVCRTTGKHAGENPRVIS